MSEADGIVVAAGDPARLDRFVGSHRPGLSRRLVHRLIADGAVRVNGRRAAKGDRVRPGDVVAMPTMALMPEPALPIPVLYEDAAMIAIDKPGGVRGHALDPWQRGTVAGFLLGRWPELEGIGTPLAPGLVHRLDTGTSGILLAARTPAAFAALRAAFAAHAVEKHYLAIVTGPGPGTTRVDCALAHDPRDRRRMIAARPGLRAWPAGTAVETLSARAGYALVAATIRTGVTHQVRVHLATIGAPVVGDLLYGEASPRLPRGRHALHAARLVLPATAVTPSLTLESRLPADLEVLLA